MKLYWIESESRYVHRLSDIPKGQPQEPREIPTDLAGLMGFINELVKKPVNCAVVETQEEADKLLTSGAGVAIPYNEAFAEPLNVPQVIVQALPPPPPDYVQPVVTPMDAAAVLSRIDSPGVPVDKIVETIGKAPMYALKRYAGAVAVRFQELANR